MASKSWKFRNEAPCRREKQTIVTLIKQWKEVGGRREDYMYKKSPPGLLFSIKFVKAKRIVKHTVKLQVFQSRFAQ